MKSELIPVDGYTLISLAEAKQQLRLDASFTGEDSLLLQYIQAAQGAAEAYTERSIANEVLTITLDKFQHAVCFEDWRPIVKADVSISVLPFGETERVNVPVSGYALLKGVIGYRVVFNNDIAVADVADAVIVTVACNVPMLVKQACLLKMADFYEIRENRGASVRETFEKLLFPFRKF